MNVIGVKEKDPNATLDYSIDWSPWLADGETIQNSVWVVPAGITQENATVSDTSATIWLSGGTNRHSYTITNRVTTTDGRIDDRSFVIQVREK